MNMKYVVMQLWQQGCIFKYQLWYLGKQVEARR